jgi:hypothetical protein
MRPLRNPNAAGIVAARILDLAAHRALAAG